MAAFEQAMALQAVALALADVESATVRLSKLVEGLLGALANAQAKNVQHGELAALVSKLAGRSEVLACVQVVLEAMEPGDERELLVEFFDLAGLREQSCEGLT